MQVTVMDRSTYWGTVTIEISDNCPTCGKPRGKPYGFNFYEDGEWYWVNRWDNPCGDIDYYSDCIKEAKTLLKAEAK